MKRKSNAGVVDDIRVVLGRQVRRLRKEAGLSQDVVAEHCGIFRTYLSRIENGTANPSVTVVAALATTLGVGVWDLFVEGERDTVGPSDS
jgi:transcriptional regulator with XRE-family HTH domain